VQTRTVKNSQFFSIEKALNTYSPHTPRIISISSPQPYGTALFQDIL